MTPYELLMFTLTACIAGLAAGFTAMFVCALWQTSAGMAKLISYIVFALVVALLFVGGNLDKQGARQFVIAMSENTLWDMTPGDCVTLNGERYCNE